MIIFGSTSGLSQPKLTRTVRSVFWICLCFVQLTGQIVATADQPDSKLAAKPDTSRSSEIDPFDAKNLDLELLSRTGDEERRSDNDPFKEILNAEESSVKEVKIEPSAELASELKSQLNAATAKSIVESKETRTESASTELSSTTISSQSTNLTTTDQLAKAPVASPADKSVDDKVVKVVESNISNNKTTDKAVDKTVDTTTDKTADKTTDKKVEKKLAHSDDPLTSASSNVDNVKNEDELKTSEELNGDEKHASDKLESSLDELKASHRESSELNIEESSKFVFGHLKVT